MLRTKRFAGEQSADSRTTSSTLGFPIDSRFSRSRTIAEGRGTGEVAIRSDRSSRRPTGPQLPDSSFSPHGKHCNRTLADKPIARLTTEFAQQSAVYPTASRREKTARPRSIERRPARPRSLPRKALKLPRHGTQHLQPQIVRQEIRRPRTRGVASRQVRLPPRLQIRITRRPASRAKNCCDSVSSRHAPANRVPLFHGFRFS